MESKKLAVVALSGGLDSCVTLAIAKQDYEVAILHANYHQRTEKKELECFNKIGDFYNIKKRLIVSLEHLKAIGGTSLIDENMNVPKADLHSSEIPNTYVPFRNANILAIATSWAEVLNAESVFIGAVYEDSSGYPDCRPQFFDAFNLVIKYGTKPDFNCKIQTPIISMSKQEIVKKGLDLKAPLNLTWSCYQNEDEACGVCDSCALRLRGFQQAGTTDPIKYKVIPNYL